MNGIKLARDGKLDNKDVLGLVIDTEKPFWKCDLKAKPLHYGVVKANVTGVAPFSSKTIFDLNHGYDHVPSFLAAWNFPKGTSPGNEFSNQTYGIGSFEAFTEDFDLITVNVEMTGTRFRMVVDNTFSSDAVAAFYIEYRYYIFAEALDDILS